MDGDVMVRDVMTREYVGVSESDSVLGAVRLMRDERVGGVVVLRGQEPVGILTEWDVVGVVAEGMDPEGTAVSDVMSKPVLTMDADRSLADAAGTMSNENIRHLLIVDEGDGVSGLLTERDVITASASLGTAPTTEPEMRSVEPLAEPAANGNGRTAEYSSQSICEGCGSLARDLNDFNGQLICADCRDV